MNTNNEHQQILNTLLRQHYDESDIGLESNATSSHWKQFGNKIEVQRNELGFITKLAGVGFGYYRNDPNNRIAWFMDRLSIASHLLLLKHRAHLIKMWWACSRVVRSMDLYPTFDAFRQSCAAALF